MTAEAETQILLQEISTFAFIGERNLGKGKFVVSTTGLHWCAIDSPSSENLDFHVPCKSVVVHAISRDISAFPEECIYCMIDDQFPLPGDQDGAEERDDPDDKSEECSELRFVPEDKSLLDQIYAAIVECQNLNPDTESEDSSDDEGRFEDSAGDGNGWIFAESNGQQDGDGQNDIVLPAPDEFVNMVNEQQETGETDEMMDVGQFDDVEKSDEQDHS
ncbi:methylosome subunit pICln-like [Corticium candelabrum]|uniref:methylosome subunit pICln-like n=1 Tax=Corticium candelabrum TaxID=121492 RepID=UPI002E25B21F|nr:methylosome subunit pICln-like [Corticium candelabrum]